MGSDDAETRPGAKRPSAHSDRSCNSWRSLWRGRHGRPRTHTPPAPPPPHPPPSTGHRWRARRFRIRRLSRDRPWTIDISASFSDPGRRRADPYGRDIQRRSRNRRPFGHRAIGNGHCAGCGGDDGHGLRPGRAFGDTELRRRGGGGGTRDGDGHAGTPRRSPRSTRRSACPPTYATRSAARSRVRPWSGRAVTRPSPLSIRAVW